MANRYHSEVHPDKSSVARAMREVHKNIPSTVPSWKKGKAKEKMLEAIAFSKARRGK